MRKPQIFDISALVTFTDPFRKATAFMVLPVILVNHQASNVDTTGKSLKAQCFRFKVCWRDSCWSWWWGFFQDLAQHIWLSTFVVCYYGFPRSAGLLKALSQHWWGGLVRHFEARRFVAHLWVGCCHYLRGDSNANFGGLPLPEDGLRT